MKIIGSFQCTVAGFTSQSLLSSAVLWPTAPVMSNALLYFSVWRDMGHRLAFSLLLWNRGTLSFVAWCPQKSFSRAVATKEFWSTSKTCAFHCNTIKMHGGENIFKQYPSTTHLDLSHLADRPSGFILVFSFLFCMYVYTYSHVCTCMDGIHAGQRLMLGILLDLYLSCLLKYEVSLFALSS